MMRRDGSTIATLACVAALACGASGEDGAEPDAGPVAGPAWSRDLSSAVAANVYIDRSVVSSRGEVIVCGAMSPASPENRDVAVDFGGGPRRPANGDGVFLAAYARDGAYLWDRVFDVDVSPTCALALDAADNVFLAVNGDGALDLGGGANELRLGFAIAGFSPTGDRRWDVVVPTIGLSSFAGVTGLAGAADGSVAASGSFAGSVDFGGGARSDPGAFGGFVLALDGAGGYRWDHAVSDASALGVVVDPDGRVVAGGFSFGAGDLGDGVPLDPARPGFVVAYAPGGELRWKRLVDASVEGLAIDEAGDIHVASPPGYLRLDRVAGRIERTWVRRTAWWASERLDRGSCFVAREGRFLGIATPEEDGGDVIYDVATETLRELPPRTIGDVAHPFHGSCVAADQGDDLVVVGQYGDAEVGRVGFISRFSFGP